MMPTTKQTQFQTSNAAMLNVSAQTNNQFLVNRLSPQEKEKINQFINTISFQTYLNKKLKKPAAQGLYISCKKHKELPRSLIVYRDQHSQLHYLVQLKAKLGGGRKPTSSKKDNYYVGKGAMRTVKYACDLKTQKVYAVTMDKPEAGRPSEIKILKNFNHPNIIKPVTYAHYQRPIKRSKRGRTEKRNAMVAPFCEQGAMLSIDKSTNDSAIAKIAVQLLLAVKHMHDKKWCHNDLKPENVLLTKDYDVKIADLDCATKFKTNNVQAGSPAYMSPECWLADSSLRERRLLAPQLINNDKVPVVANPWNRPQNDMWAMGLIFWQLANKLFPKDSVYQPTTNFILDDFDVNKLNNSSEIKKVILELTHGMLQPDRKKRIDVDTALQQLVVKLLQAKIITLQDEVMQQLPKETLNTVNALMPKSDFPEKNNTKGTWLQVKNLMSASTKNQQAPKQTISNETLLQQYKKLKTYDRNFMGQVAGPSKMAQQVAKKFADFFVYTCQDQTDIKGESSMRFLSDAGKFLSNSANPTAELTSPSARKQHISRAIEFFTQQEPGVEFFSQVFDALQQNKDKIYNKKHPMFDAIRSVFGLRGTVRTNTRQKHITKLRAKALEGLQQQLQTFSSGPVSDKTVKLNIDWLKEQRQKKIFSKHRTLGFFNKVRKTSAQKKIDKMIKVEEEKLSGPSKK